MATMVPLVPFHWWSTGYSTGDSTDDPFHIQFTIVRYGDKGIDVYSEVNSENSANAMARISYTFFIKLIYTLPFMNALCHFYV